jgi:hypothetical protein
MSTQALVCVADPSSEDLEREVTRLFRACGASHARSLFREVGIGIGVGARVKLHNPAAQPRFSVLDRCVVASVGDGLDWDQSWSIGDTSLRSEVKRGSKLSSRRFATVVWDKHSRRLLAARDPLGVEPLYYVRLPGGGIALCSSGTALLELPGVSRAIDRNACAESLLVLRQQPGSTFFEQVKELPRACWLEWYEGAVEVRRYHRIGPKASDESMPDRSRRFRELFQAAVARSSETTPELAVTLSGGLDSSSVFRVAYAQPNIKLRAISAVFPNDPDTHEEEFLEAALCGTDVQSRRFEPKVPFQLEQLLEVAEDPTSIPMFSMTIACALQARTLGAECLLTGDYGDFVAGSVSKPAMWLLRHGYWNRAWHEFGRCGGSTTRRALRFGRQALRLVIEPLWRRSPPGSVGSIRRRITDFMSLESRSRLMLDEPSRKMCGRQTPSEEPTPDGYETFFDGLGGRHVRASWLVERLCDLRLEHPFCDPDLVAWSAGLRFDERWAHGRNRAAFRRAMAGTVPDRILQRGSKARFDGPHDRYMRDLENALTTPNELWPLDELLELRDVDGMLLGLRSEGLAGRHRALAALLLAGWLRMHGRLQATQSY